MLHTDQEMQELKEELLAMWDLVIRQLKYTERALLNDEKNRAFEVQEREKRVNAFELSLDRRVEQFVARFQPVVADLRFALTALKINSNLERIGDITCGIAEFITDMDQDYNPEIVKALGADQMLLVAIEMIKDLREAYHMEDSQLARTIFKRDVILNEINNKGSYQALDCLKKYKDQKRQVLHVLSIVRKLERLGDQSKNIAEEIIFFLEADVVKHPDLETEE